MDVSYMLIQAGTAIYGFLVNRLLSQMNLPYSLVLNLLNNPDHLILHPIRRP